MEQHKVLSVGQTRQVRGKVPHSVAQGRFTDLPASDAVVAPL